MVIFPSERTESSKDVICINEEEKNRGVKSLRVVSSLPNRCVTTSLIEGYLRSKKKTTKIHLKIVKYF